MALGCAIGALEVQLVDRIVQIGVPVGMRKGQAYIAELVQAEVDGRLVDLQVRTACI